MDKINDETDGTEPKSEGEERICLKCNSSFRSILPKSSNRICNGCKSKNSKNSSKVQKLMLGDSKPLQD